MTKQAVKLEVELDPEIFELVYEISRETNMSIEEIILDAIYIYLGEAVLKIFEPSK